VRHPVDIVTAMATGTQPTQASRDSAEDLFAASQLIDRAQDVVGDHERMRGLLTANTIIIGNLTLPVVLRRIVEAACQLVNARYGALGVLAPGGRELEAFIHVGMDDATAARIGHLPCGKGVLAALIDDPRPIRLSHISDDPRSVGFPDHHPPMDSFLGVPIRVRDDVFGNLYLSEARSGAFTADDEHVVAALAATAGIAIENARLFDQADRRQRWLTASMQITRQLLAADGEEPLALIARLARDIADAEIVSVVLPTADRSRLMVEVAAGEHADELTGYTYAYAGSLAGRAMDSGRPQTVDDATSQTVTPIHLTEVLPAGPVMALPLAGAARTRGALVIGRIVGRAVFDGSELDMATTFANHAAVALELADARADQQRVALLEDRDRIARDLHDHVIQRLFAAGLTLQGLAAAGGGPAGDRLNHVVDEIDETIRQIRTTIFELRGPLGPQTGSLRAHVLQVVGEVTPLLRVEPRVRFAGPLDSGVADHLTHDLLAVLREALTNIARHADATMVEVTLAATASELCLEVTDDGVGLGGVTRRSGLANMHRRATKHRGTFTAQPARPAAAESATTAHRDGTRLRWTIPL
jgi:signal transduction histidine kinase